MPTFPDDADALGPWDTEAPSFPPPPPPPPPGARRSGTIPPPEMSGPSSARELVLTRAQEALADAARVRAPIVRRIVGQAQEALLRSALLRAAASGDAQGEHEAAGSLARLLASRGIFLEEAIELARRALAAADDPALRAELAGWLAGLGEPALAAAALLELSRRSDAERAPSRTLVKVGILLARSGDAAGALETWARAAEADTTDATGLELIGMAEAWCPDDCTPNEVLDAYLEAARRRSAAGDADSAHLDRLRALAVAEQPGLEAIGETAARAIARELRSAGKLDAADEVLRALAARSSEELAAVLHEERMRTALEDGAFVRAVAAALDGGLLGERGDLGPLVERALKGAGLDALARARGVEKTDDGVGPILDAGAEPAVRARALAALGSEVGGPSGALLLAVAAELESAQGSAELARGHARDAFGLDTTSPRALAVLSELLGREGGRSTANVLEQAARRGVMRIRTCLRLADLLREAGDAEGSVAWVQRGLALRPGDSRLIERLVDGAIEGGSLAKLEEVMLWTLAQPRPASDVVPYILRALERVAELERAQLEEGAALPRTGALARRALDVLGPKRAEVRDVLRAVAEAAGDLQLLVSLLERSVAVEHDDEAARATFLELASLREQGGDFDGAIRELYRALAREADPQEIRERVYQSDEARMDADAELGSDAEIARAAVLAATATTGPSTTEALEGAEAYRALAAIVYDAAGDTDGADAALLQADYLTRDAGVSRYAQDLAQLLGTAVAAERIRMRVAEVAAAEDATEDDRRIHASLALQAAQVSSDAGVWDESLRLAELALTLEPTRADVLAMIERCAEQTGDLPAVDRAYEAAGRAALGCYGRRAAHYRAARLLERKGDLRSALRHAIQSFEAVPTEGQGFQMVVRLAAESGSPAEAARSIARVADGMRGDQRVLWLLRAAQTTNDTEEGLRTKVDVLLRALAIRADAIVVRELGAAVDWLSAAGADLEVERLRFSRACESMLAKAEGPDGARAGVELGRVATMAFGDVETGVRAIERAMGADGDIDEYAELLPLVGALGRERASGERLLGLAVQQVSQPYSSVGGALLKFSAKLAEELGDEEQRARLVVEAARKASEDAELVVAAFDALVRHDGAPLGAELSKSFGRISTTDRFDSLQALARSLVGTPDAARAARALEEACRAAPRDDAARDAWLDEASELASQLGPAAERVTDDALRAEVSRRKDPRALARPGKVLAGRLVRRGDAAAALELLISLAELGVAADALSHEVGAIAQATTNPSSAEGGGAASRLRVAGPQTGGRTAILRMLADALRDTGSPVSLEAYRHVVEQTPEDAGALEGLEQAAGAAGDHATVAELLAKKIERAPKGATRRALRLRRAAILEQRLGRVADARAELEAQRTDTPEDPLVLRFLADLLERAKEPQAASALWIRLGELTSSADERAEYGLRVVRCQLASGDLDAARQTLASVATFAPREQALELRVEIAKRTSDPVQIADALEELAAASQAPAEHRASHLVDAAEANVYAERFDLAPEQVIRALRLAPHDGRVVVGAHRVAYLLRGGPGDAAEGKQTAADLVRVIDSLPASEAEVHAFLLAEALDVALPDKGAGERELSKRHAELGPTPLIAVGLAERLARTSDRKAQALALFERALNGELRGLRTPAEVALQAGEVASALGQPDKATALFAIAAGEPQLAAAVVQKMANLGLAPLQAPMAAPAAEPAAAPVAEPAAAPVAEPAAAPVAEPAAAPATEPAATPAAEPADDEARREALADAAPEVQVANGPAALPPDEAPPESLDEPGDVMSVEDDELLEDASGQRVVSPRSDIQELRPSTPPPATAIPEPPPVVGSDVRVPDGADEASLFRELMAGSYEAGEALVSLYGEELTHHRREIVALRRQQAILRPGDRPTLERLHEAAKVDGNLPMAHALEHVLAGFSGGAAVEAPMVAVQQAPELVNALLFRDITVPIFEALALVWDSGIYKRDLGHYQLTGLERVQVGAPGAVSERLGEVARALGLKRPSLYYQRQVGPLRGSVALIQPPAAVFRGELRDDPRELGYAIGSMLTATAPEYVLAVALPEEQGLPLVEALLAAFAPVDHAPPSRAAAVVKLEQSLWQLIPRRSERRLRELCADPASFRFDLAAVGARQAMRRAGLFACGDLPTAVRMTLSELGADADLPFASPDGLAVACRAHPEIADLVTLATSAEYAEARWSSRR